MAVARLSCDFLSDTNRELNRDSKMDVTVYLCVFGIVLAVILLLMKYGTGKKEARNTTIPGLDMSHPELGNFPDMAESGSLHEFLLSLHQKYGDIVSFWWGRQMVVSISSPELFKQQSRIFDRPIELFALFRPFITEHSIQYANGPEGQSRHAAYSRCFSETAMANYYSVIQQTTREVVEKFGRIPEDEHVPLRKYMFAYAIKTVLLAVFGESFQDEETILRLKHSYDIVWNDLENQLCGDLLVEGTERMMIFRQECDNIFDTMKSVWEKAQENPSTDPSRSNFVDVISMLDISPEEKSADMVSVFVASFHTTGLLMTWCLYYLANDHDVQQKAAEEVKQVTDDPIEPDSINKFVYLRQVIDETMRCSVLAPYAARYSDDDTVLGGHHVPAGTPVIHALGVSLQDPQRWPEPEKFDPERFSPSNRKKISTFGFEPFGFAGKRKCLGYRFSLVEVTILLANIIRKLEVSLVPGQEIVPVHGLVTAPKEEIWVMFKKRE